MNPKSLIMAAALGAFSGFGHDFNSHSTTTPRRRGKAGGGRGGYRLRLKTKPSLMNRLKRAMRVNGRFISRLNHFTRKGGKLQRGYHL